MKLRATLRWIPVLCSILYSASLCQAADAEKKTVKVFILAGQSNMEGKAKVSLLDYQVKQPATRPLFAHFERDGKWAEREDVWIKFLDRKGPLTTGYGSPNCIGPELQFGWTAGDHCKEPVLLIKTAHQDGMGRAQSLARLPFAFSFPANPGLSMVVRWLVGRGRRFQTSATGVTPPSRG